MIAVIEVQSERGECIAFRPATAELLRQVYVRAIAKASKRQTKQRPARSEGSVHLPGEL